MIHEYTGGQLLTRQQKLFPSLTIDKLEDLHLRLERGEVDQGAEGERTLWAALRLASLDPTHTSAATAKKLATFNSMLDRFSVEQPKLLLSEFYHLILDETGYVRSLREEGTEEALARIENLEEFDSLLQEFEEDVLESVPENERPGRLRDLLALFIEQSTLASEADQKIEESSVRMMTLHASKGLEFPVVFLVGMEEGLFPSVKQWEEESEDDLEEERRLCYVGITRARELLYMTHVSMRRIWGNVSYQEPARFFSEIPDDLIDFRDLSYGAAASRFRPGSSRWMDRDTPSIPDAASKRERLVYDEYSQSAPAGDDLVGARLEHPDYGPGRVLSVEGVGDDRKVMVEFKGRDRRKFLFRYVASFIQS
ncbi:hypothetical protein EBZ37_07565 [bacterium]|nr:hypothetical protein [bacterium]